MMGQRASQQVCRWQKPGRNGCAIHGRLGSLEKRVGRSRTNFNKKYKLLPLWSNSSRHKKVLGPTSWQRAWQKSFPGFPRAWLGRPAWVPVRGAGGTCLPAALAAWICADHPGKMLKQSFQELDMKFFALWKGLRLLLKEMETSRTSAHFWSTAFCSYLVPPSLF